MAPPFKKRILDTRPADLEEKSPLRENGKFLSSKLTPEEKDALKDEFLEQWFHTKSQIDAAAIVGVPYNTLRAWRLSDEEFRKKWEVCRDAIVDSVEDALVRAASNPKSPASVTAALGYLNAYRAEHFRRTGASGDGEAVTVKLIIGERPDEPKRLPAQSGAEITIETDGDK